jgi:hypothetical protein
MAKRERIPRRVIVRKVLKEYRMRKLRSGSPDGPIVKKKSQALAIAKSMASRENRR